MHYNIERYDFIPKVMEILDRMAQTKHPDWYQFHNGCMVCNICNQTILGKYKLTYYSMDEENTCINNHILTHINLSLLSLYL